MKLIFIALHEGVRPVGLAGHVDVQKCTLLCLVIKQQPLPLVSNVLHGSRHLGAPLVGGQGVLVNHGQASTTFVLPAPLSSPDMEARNFF